MYHHAVARYLTRRADPRPARADRIAPLVTSPGLYVPGLVTSVPACGRVAIPHRDARRGGARRSTAMSIVEGVDHRAHGLQAAERGWPQQRVLVQALPALGEPRAHLVGRAGQRDRVEHLVGHGLDRAREVAADPRGADALSVL